MDTALRLTPRPVVDSIEELLSGATERTPFITSDSKSGNSFDRVVIEGIAHIVKYVHVDDDFTIRALGDLGPRALTVWSSGLMDLAPDIIDHTVVAAAGGLGRNGWGAAILMRDVGRSLVPPGDEPVPLDQHRRLLDHCAALAARAWGWRDDIGLTPYAARFAFLGPSVVAAERELGFPTVVPRIAGEGWQRFAERAAPDVRAAVAELHRDLDPLVVALQTTPSTFLHGDWKFGNLGNAADGRTILLDWSYPGEGPICHDLGWYLALNSGRLPESKDDAIVAFRVALEAHGVDTQDWWDRQLALGLLGTFVQFGWEKAFGGDEELEWWSAWARRGMGEL